MDIAHRVRYQINVTKRLSVNLLSLRGLKLLGAVKNYIYFLFFQLSFFNNISKSFVIISELS